MRLQLKPYGVSAAAGTLDTTGRHAADATPALNRVADVLRSGQALRFAQGRGWRALDPDTRARKTRQHLPTQRLVASGRLRESLTRKGAPGSVSLVRPTELRFGTRVEYARFHERGAGVPKRKLLRISREQRGFVRRILRDHVAPPRGRA